MVAVARCRTGVVASMLVTCCMVDVFLITFDRSLLLCEFASDCCLHVFGISLLVVVCLVWLMLVRFLNVFELCLIAFAIVFYSFCFVCLHALDLLLLGVASCLFALLLPLRFVHEYSNTILSCMTSWLGPLPRRQILYRSIKQYSLIQSAPMSAFNQHNEGRNFDISTRTSVAEGLAA